MGYINRTKVLQAVAGNSKQIQLRSIIVHYMVLK